MTDQDFMREALKEAQLAFEKGEIPIGAVLVRDGNIIARDHNRREELDDPTAHAEILVLREAGRTLGGWRLPNTTLYVTIEPCPMCAGGLVQARVARVVYGAADIKAGAVHSLYTVTEDERLNHRLEVTGGVLAEECADIMRTFFRSRRKKGTDLFLQN
ncbi:tRNA adenosine(34) deaminase TadA [Dethiobacter alkaliphilus]|uniref:tRNA-specific adenosine deaminase n=1 Tax=Dethiobacter alkaliphilus AHT 1 TaxID=555088 RepID=C0GKA3_DETAL|nr:tRNA adenosine(34) deaminase TadA [Dethiobacter alkaliphilus]EEG76218.1 CMP/dCMP deaminase zinc-binding [Dethiobacter alkaliphilus AHT 1]